MFQGISLKKRGREREKKGERVDAGGARFPRNWPISLFSRKAFILLVVHRDQWIIQSHAGSAALTLIETRLSFCISFCIQKVSGDLHYLLAKRPVNILWLFFLINVNQPKNSFSLEVFFFNLHHPQSTK